MTKQPLQDALTAVRTVRDDCKRRGLGDFVVAQALMLEAMDAMRAAYGPHAARLAMEELAPLLDQ